MRDPDARRDQEMPCNTQRFTDIAIARQSLSSRDRMKISVSDALEPVEHPSVAELLDVDREFRRQGAAVFHTRRAGRPYTALFSPTPLARRQRRERDWVILDLELPGPHRAWTVVTERRGVLKGRRVVRGRETECFAHYRARSDAHAA